MPIFAPPPQPRPAIIFAVTQELPSLSFAGLRAHMPMSETRALAASAGGSLTCKATTDPRLRECNGAMRYPKTAGRFQLLVSSVRDTAAVIVLTANAREADIRDWARALTQEFGEPSHKTDHRGSESWQWVRRSQMLRLIQHKAGGSTEVAVTLTDGPLLDALGPPPSLQRVPGPKKQKPD